MAQLLVPSSDIVQFAVENDYLHSQLVLVTVYKDGTLRYQWLSWPLPSFGPDRWSSSYAVKMPVAAQAPTNNLCLVKSAWGSLLCVGIGRQNQLFAFRLYQDEQAEPISGPAGIRGMESIAVSDWFTGNDYHEILAVGIDQNNQAALYHAQFSAKQWPPPASNLTYAHWANTGPYNTPAFAYGPTTVKAFTMSGYTLSHCWRYKSDKTPNWGRWWGLGNVSGNPYGVSPQTIAWHSAPDQPQADAVFVRQEDGTLLYAVETGADSTSWYALKPTSSGVKADKDPVLVPWNNYSIVMLAMDGAVKYTLWALKEDVGFGQFEPATDLRNVWSFQGRVVPVGPDVEDARPYLLGFYHTVDGIWIDGVNLRNY